MNRCGGAACNTEEDIVEHRSDWYQEAGKWIAGAAAGAVLMYMLDPDRGRTRRVHSTDQIKRLGTRTGNGVGRALRDIGNRLGGMQARVSNWIAHPERSNIDDVVEARVRAKLGRIVSNPHSIEVKARDGKVSLHGPILARERPKLIDMVRSIRGVSMVDDQLGEYAHAGDIPGLQATHAVQRYEREDRDAWPASTRGLAIIGGAALGLYGIGRRTPLALGLGALGLGLLARGMSNVPFTSMAGMGTARSIHLTKSIEIEAAPDKLYDMWTDYENFPRFMSHVLDVRDLGGERSHWVVEGPAGTRVEWDSRLTEKIRPQRIAWNSEAGSEVEHSGSVQFEPTRRGTRVTIQMAYSPPAGAIGNVVAALMGRDPEHELEDDLMRMKTFVETGRAPRDAGEGKGPAGQLYH